MEITSSDPPSSTCEPCLKGKQTRTIIRKEMEICADKILGWIYSDICGKLPICSHQGNFYFVIWVDDFSCKVFITRMREKLEVVQHLKAFISQAKLETRSNLKVLRSDGGGEYTASELQKFLKEKGIRHEMTTIDTPQHNGIVECMNCSLVEWVWMMLMDADLPKSYWWDALQYTTFLYNCSPMRSLEDMTLEEAWSRNKPDISCVHIFGYYAFIHILEKMQDKLAAKSLICTFLSYT